jgi:hypothetical protein
MNTPLKYGVDNKEILQAKNQAKEAAQLDITNNIGQVIDYSIANGIKTKEEIFQKLQQTTNLKESYLDLDREGEKYYLNSNLDKLNNAKSKETTIENVLEVVKKEQEFLATCHGSIKYLEQYPKELIDKITVAYQGKQDNIIEELQTVTTHIGQYQIMQENKLVEHLKNSDNPAMTSC